MCLKIRYDRKSWKNLGFEKEVNKAYMEVVGLNLSVKFVSYLAVFYSQ